MRGASRSTRPPLWTVICAILAAGLLNAAPGRAQESRDPGTDPPPTVAARTAGMDAVDGFFPMYWEASSGKLWLEISRWDTDVLYVSGLAAGLGSNDIGLDRGQLRDSRIVRFERRGPKVLLVQPNYRYRATSANQAEVAAVDQAFARSVVWGFTVAAESDSGATVLVDVTDFLLRDSGDLARALRPGSYRLDASRSSVFRPMVQGFPQNSEMEAELTFVRQAEPGASGPPGGGEAFEGVGNVAASGEAASLRVHHSLIALPDDDYEPRAFDPRAGYWDVTWQDYAVPLGEPLTKRFIGRHRLQKRDPSAQVSEPIAPIVYYLDPGVPEPMRSALVDGARWWNEAFEAAGYRDAFRVELLPDGVSPLDIRYNVINWVHRSTRGWSYGATVTDPRTGEIIKGVVTLGSLRVRQDYLLAEGLLSPYEEGDETPSELAEWALARIRQLSAHEVGHTLGLAHNYYDSTAGRISVLDYPHPLVTVDASGGLDYSAVYDVGIGEWDTVAIRWGYGDFPPETDEEAQLDAILDEAWDRDIRFLTNQDLEITPRADQWANGTDPAAELDRMMSVRRIALARFGDAAIPHGRPLATLEEVLVPLYLHHRFQVEAAASALGGLDYLYTVRGDGRQPFSRVSAERQRAALDALLRTITPEALALPEAVIARIPPRPMGYERTRELFPRWTGTAFDAITPAAVAARMVVTSLLDPERAARLVEQHALDPDLPGLSEVIDRLTATAFDAPETAGYTAELARAVQHVVVSGLIDLAGNTQAMPQARAAATLALDERRRALRGTSSGSDRAAHAHALMLSREIERHLDRPAAPASPVSGPEAPPGAPIGDLPRPWLRMLEPACGW
jgi:hypothetical protein